MTRKLKYPKSVAAVKAAHSARSCSQSLLRFGDLGSYAAGFVSSQTFYSALQILHAPRNKGSLRTISLCRFCRALERSSR